MIKLKKVYAIFVLIGFIVVGCKTQKGKLEFVTPKAGQTVLKGEQIQLKLNFPDTTLDSVIYSVDGDVFASKTDTTSVLFDTNKFAYGNRSISAKAYYSGKEDIAYSNITIVPDTPTQYGFELINTFPHDSLAFTQGLQYENGVLYESTGLDENSSMSKSRTALSSLRKVDLRTGRVLQKVDLDTKHFGEGMTIVGNKIILLTWTSGIGFVYDKSTFQLLETFDYPNPQQEGWGIAYDGERLIMGDGTSFLYFLDPETYRQTGSVQVFDNRGAVSNLNELEYIDGKLYANLYHQDRDEIVIIDPNTGVIEGRANLVGLYDGKRQSTGNEMNGIAYNKETGSLYLTGKDWTKLYEVRLVER